MEVGLTEYTRLKCLETVAERLVEENTELKNKLQQISNWVSNIDFANFQLCIDKIKELAE